MISGVATVTFGDGLHAYQNPPTQSYQIPVKLELVGPKGKLSAKYPAGTLGSVGGDPTPSRLYEGKVSIPFSVKLSKPMHAGEIKLRLSYQQCTEQSCFPPSSVLVVAKLAPAKSKKG